MMDPPRHQPGPASPGAPLNSSTLFEGARQFGLPAPERLLDVDAVLDALATGLFDGAELIAVEPCYLRLKPGTHLLVLYRVVLRGDDGEEVEEFVHGSLGDGTVASREADKWRMLHPGLGDVDAHVAIDEAQDLVFARFPYDLGLRALAWMVVPERLKRFHEDVGHPLSGGRPVLIRARRARIRVLSYRPRRRCVVHWNVRTKQEGEKSVRRKAVLRLLSAPAGASVDWREREPDQDVVPRLMGVALDRQLLVEEDVGGEVLAESLHRESVAEVGALLGRFHHWSRAASRGDDQAGSDLWWDQRCAEAAYALEHLALLAPSLTGSCRSLGEALGRHGRPRTTGPWAGLHGDLHLGQIQRAEAGLRLVDLDRAQVGPTAADLGSLLSHLVLEGLEEESVWGQLAEGAATAGDPLPEWNEVRHAGAIALLRGAVDPLRRFADNAMTRTHRRLDLAHRWLTES